jgi:hypothetical protein
VRRREPGRRLPFGFECRGLSRRPAGRSTRLLCVLAEHCGACTDLDGDGRGLGRCGTAGTVTATDCDDRDPRAYHDPADPEHAFPDACAVQDLNCNGLSDDTEEIGPAHYPREHCTACFDACGAVPNGTALQPGAAADDASPRCCRPVRLRDAWATATGSW